MKKILDQVDAAYERVLASNVKYRFVIDFSTMLIVWKSVIAI